MVREGGGCVCVLWGGEHKGRRAEGARLLWLCVHWQSGVSRVKRDSHGASTECVLRNKSHNKGLISADRRTKPTLTLTIPR